MIQETKMVKKIGIIIGAVISSVIIIAIVVIVVIFVIRMKKSDLSKQEDKNASLKSLTNFD